LRDGIPQLGTHQELEDSGKTPEMLAEEKAMLGVSNGHCQEKSHCRSEFVLAMKKKS